MRYYITYVLYSKYLKCERPHIIKSALTWEHRAPARYIEECRQDVGVPIRKF